MNLENLATGVIAVLGVVSVGMVVLYFYMFPSILAHRARHRNFPAIIVLNVLTGWTGLGWVIALVWACTR